MGKNEFAILIKCSSYVLVHLRSIENTVVIFLNIKSSNLYEIRQNHENIQNYRSTLESFKYNFLFYSTLQ